MIRTAGQCISQKYFVLPELLSTLGIQELPPTLWHSKVAVAVTANEKECDPQKHVCTGNLESWKVITQVGSCWGSR